MHREQMDFPVTFRSSFPAVGVLAAVALSLSACASDGPRPPAT